MKEIKNNDSKNKTEAGKMTTILNNMDHAIEDFIKKEKKRKFVYKINDCLFSSIKKAKEYIDKHFKYTDMDKSWEEDIIYFYDIEGHIMIMITKEFLNSS